MILDVPYKSQLPYETSEEGERQWCGIVSLWMVLSYHLKEAAPGVEDLLQKYGDSVVAKGFQHKDFLQIVRDFGLRGFRKSWWAEPVAFPLMDKFLQEGESEEDIKDWAETNLEESLFTLKRMIDQGIPVIVSVNKEFSPSHSSHLIVVIGYENNTLIANDPLHKGPNYKISEGEFKNFWIRQAIIIKREIKGQKNTDTL